MKKIKRKRKDGFSIIFERLITPGKAVGFAGSLRCNREKIGESLPNVVKKRTGQIQFFDSKMNCKMMGRR
ncbi:hypothetical protein DBR45_31385 [Pseudomonas sp. HMWF031]|nr:hypothetical protein DBR45_31385 [Pseudomonas sp. HMWF031]